jgi:succinylglutamate desuccinylase
LGIDLNRDFTVIEAQVQGLKQPETSALASFLENDLKQENRTLELTMDYHCCIGGLLYPWSFKGPTLPPEQEIKHLNIVEIMRSTIGGEIKYGTTPNILGYSAKGTSKDFYYEHFGATSFTFEGRRNREDKYFEEHTRMWELILKRFELTSI